MILTNFLVGLLVMLVCLAIQAFVTFWCVRYFVRRSRQLKPKPEDYLRAGLRPLLVAMVAMMLVEAGPDVHRHDQVHFTPGGRLQRHHAPQAPVAVAAAVNRHRREEERQR